MPKSTAPPTDTDLVVEALRARADQRKRACTALAAELDRDRQAGRDVRSGAVKVVDELAAADRMQALARDLEGGDVRVMRVLATEYLNTGPGIPPIPVLASPDAPDDALLFAAAPDDASSLVPEYQADEGADGEDDDEIITVDLT